MNSIYSYKKTNTLTDKQKKDIMTLHDACIETDGKNALLYCDEGDNIYPKLNTFYYAYESEKLVGYAGVFAPDGYVMTIYPLTHPKYRRRGIFKSLFEMITDEFNYFKYETFSFPVNPDYELGKKICKHLGAYEYSTEHLMILDIKEKSNVSTPFFLSSYDTEGGSVYLLCEKTLKLFTRHIGSLEITRDLNTVCLSHFEIARSKRGKGYGRLMLKLLCNDLFDKGIDTIILHVSSNNPIALKLYESFGFKIKESMTYMNIENKTITP